MASKKDTVDFILDQVGSRIELSAKKMFGEYCLYCAGRIVGFVADDQLLLKPTEAGRKILGKPVEGFPYPGAKPCFLISGDRWEDGEWLAGLIQASAMELPIQPPKKPK